MTNQPAARTYAEVAREFIEKWFGPREGVITDQLAALISDEVAIAMKEIGPDLEGLRGIAPDATGELSSEAFVRKLRDDWDDVSAPPTNVITLAKQISAGCSHHWCAENSRQASADLHALAEYVLAINDNALAEAVEREALLKPLDFNGEFDALHNLGGAIIDIVNTADISSQTWICDEVCLRTLKRVEKQLGEVAAAIRARKP